jgi:hypothetical protein
MSSDRKAFTTTCDAQVTDDAKHLNAGPPRVLDDPFIEK